MAYQSVTKEEYFNMVDRKRQLDRMILELNAEYQEIIWEGNNLDKVRANEHQCDELYKEREKLLYKMEKAREQFTISSLRHWKAEYNAR